MAYIVKRGRAYDAELLRSYESMVQRVFDSAGVSLSAFPAVDVREEADRYVIEAELPGFSPDDVDVQVKDGVLTIASAAGTEDGKDDRPDGSRRRVRPFSRRFSLPRHADSARIEAVFVHGVLMVSLHKQPEARPRRIPVAVVR